MDKPSSAMRFLVAALFPIGALIFIVFAVAAASLMNSAMGPPEGGMDDELMLLMIVGLVGGFAAVGVCFALLALFFTKFKHLPANLAAGLVGGPLVFLATAFVANSIFTCFSFFLISGGIVDGEILLYIDIALALILGLVATYIVGAKWSSNKLSKLGAA